MKKVNALDFGLAFISAFRYKYGITEPMLLREIAECCRELAIEAGIPTRGCTWQRIHQIQERGLRKIRIRLSKSTSAELLDHLQFRKL